MFNTMIGKYFPTESTIHKMNSTSKIICVLLFLIVLSITNNVILLVLLGFITLLMMMLSNVPAKLYLRSISSLKILLGFILVLNLIFGVSIITSLIVISKIILGVLYTIILTYTTSSTEITYGLEMLLKPLEKIGIPVNKMALTIALALRFIPTIMEQGEKILKSQACRGIDYNNSNIKGKVIALSSMLLPMFILSFKRADNIADSMEVRLYNFNNKRTNYRMNNWGYFDDVMVTLHALAVILYILKGVFL